jgi:hypothetical protein
MAMVPRGRKGSAGKEQRFALAGKEQRFAPGGKSI